MGKPLIELKNVTFHYYQSHKNALEDICLSVYPGEWVAIIGHNGSGKSTLAKLMNGILSATDGEVLVEGITLTEESVWEARRKIGMVFQNPDNQFVGATVEEDIAFGMENVGLSREEMIQRVDTVLKQVRMSDFKKHEPARLSGGQKQRIAIAGIMALRPRVIILDEATSMLDPKGREEVIQTIRKLYQEEKVTVISITHDIDEAAQADRIIMMDHGMIKMTGTPNEVFQLGEVLAQNGLDVPFSEKLKSELKRKGISIPNEYMTEERMVDWIWTSLLNK